MVYILPQKYKSTFENWAFEKEVFTPEECDKIIAMGADKWQAAIVGTGEGQHNEEIRRSEVVWLPWGAEVDWMFKRLADRTFKINDNFFGFDLTGFFEALQLTRYREDNSGFYRWHQDTGPMKSSIRKLSFVVQLTDPAEFEGGKLEIFMRQESKQQDIPLGRGTVVWFPSYEPHMVSTVTKGIRHSLVGWVSGPPFR